jgi:hypothetical protein
MTPSAQTAGGRRIRRWTRETIIEKIREWNDRYGEPPCSADWNPSLARWRAQEWRAERYREGLWPSTNAAKRPFGGSFDAAIRAAGLEPHKPGPRRRAAGLVRPDVEQRAPLAPRSVDDELLTAADRVREAEARAASLERALGQLERRAERAEAAVGDARRRARRATEREGRARRARDRVQLAERETRDVAGERIEVIVAEGEARVRAAEDQADAAGRDATDARGVAQRAEARAAAAEARAEAAERMARAARAELAAREMPAAQLGAARTAAREAESRALAAEQRSRELASLVCGEPRRLTPGELDALRAGGPSGPAVLAAALKELGRARAGGNGPALDAALAALASAAVRWRDRL